ncbi:hypothetical protein V6N11_050770 [Hibiscus sabdariffa]|uniref:Uncharacterized protein n=1 Tax=Hibiscus sabdariffa TaxID=183260 RepID=A0ABR2TBR9_9ROSI
MGLISEVLEIIFRCVSRDESALAVAQKSILKFLSLIGGSWLKLSSVLLQSKTLKIRDNRLVLPTMAL